MCFYRAQHIRAKISPITHLAMLIHGLLWSSEKPVRRRSTRTDTRMMGGENSMVLLFLSCNVFKGKGTRREMYHKPVLNVILPAA